MVSVCMMSVSVCMVSMHDFVHGGYQNGQKEINVNGKCECVNGKCEIKGMPRAYETTRIRICRSIINRE